MSYSVHINQYCDGFDITLTEKDSGGTTFNYFFSQENTVEGLVQVFRQLGVDDVRYEEVY